MTTVNALSRVAALIGDPARAAMLSLLMDGRAHTASELALTAGITAQTASGHLARLLDGELRWDDASVAPPRTWDREPEASAWRRWTARAVGWLPIESQL